MKNSLKCALLILKTISSAKSSMLIILALGISMSLAAKNAALFITYIVMMQVIMISYPFAVGEKFGADTLYATLPVSRGEYVNGLYLYAVIIQLASGVVVIALNAALSLFFSAPFMLSDVLLTLSLVSLLYTFGAGVSFPIFCGIPYAKARMLSMAPMMIVAVGVVMFSNTQIAETFLAGVFDFLTNPGTPAVIFAALLPVSAAAYFISAAVSRRVYRARDL